MTVEGAIEKHLVASLFAKTSQLIEASSGKDMEEILARHQDFLVALLNNTRLLIGRKDVSRPLRGVGLGLSQSGPSSAAELGKSSGSAATPAAT
jgi:hypothetical protein